MLISVIEISLKIDGIDKKKNFTVKKKHAYIK